MTYRLVVAYRIGDLRRTAYLLCGDRHTADDLVSTALVRPARAVRWAMSRSSDVKREIIREILATELLRTDADDRTFGPHRLRLA